MSGDENATNTYGDYGEGDKPQLLGAVDIRNPSPLLKRQ
jgi:hypothetical protein